MDEIKCYISKDKNGCYHFYEKGTGRTVVPISDDVDDTIAYDQCLDDYAMQAEERPILKERKSMKDCIVVKGTAFDKNALTILMEIKEVK